MYIQINVVLLITVSSIIEDSFQIEGYLLHLKGCSYIYTLSTVVSLFSTVGGFLSLMSLAAWNLKEAMLLRCITTFKDVLQDKVSTNK